MNFKNIFILPNVIAKGPFGIRRFPLIVIYADTESIATKIFENANSPEALLHPCNYSKQSK